MQFRQCRRLVGCSAEASGAGLYSAAAETRYAGQRAGNQANDPVLEVQVPIQPQPQPEPPQADFDEFEATLEKPAVQRGAHGQIEEEEEKAQRKFSFARSLSRLSCSSS